MVEISAESTDVSDRSNGFRKVPLPPDLQREIALTANARTVLRKRYLRRGADGQPVENEQEMFWRVAYHVARAEAEYGGEVEPVARQFYELLTALRFFPNSPTFTGAGTPLGQLAACFVLAIDDDMGRTGSGIFETLRHAALIQQTGGGNGFSFSRLRPKGALVRSSSGEATGPVGFLRVYDKAFGEIAQGGCLVPSTLVFTGRGALRLSEIVTHEERGWREHSLTVATDQGPRPSLQGYNNGVGPVLRVVTHEGLALTGTPNHKLKVQTAEGAVWRRLDQLQPGDAVQVVLGQHQGRTQVLSRPLSALGGLARLAFPAVLDEAMACFVGCLAGAGTRSADDLRLGLRLPAGSDLVWQMPALLRRLFGERIALQADQPSPDAPMTLWIADRVVRQFLALNGLDQGPEAGIPRLVRQSPPAVVAAYLRGLFASAGAPQGSVAWSSASELLVRDAAALLIGLGHRVRIVEPAAQAVPLWTLQGAGVVAVQRAGISSGVAAPASAHWAAGAADDLMPAEDQWTVTVQRVEPAGEALTLDIEVDDNHTYLAGGWVTHNSRRGANMAVLRVDHPDIREFITCKTDENAITNFNISVGVTDAFMQAVENDAPFDLINPQDGAVWETVRARDLFDLIVRQAHHNGEPGVLFLDTANRENPVPHLYALESTNPCGEQFLGPFENCCLGSINLAQHLTHDRRIDWDKLRETIELSTRFLEDVVTANAYVPAVPQLAEAAHRVRRIGLGIMGLADLMYALGVRYGSDEGQEFASQIMEYVRYHAMRTSIALARDRGPFPAIRGSRYDPDNLQWQPPIPLASYTRDWGRPHLDWGVIEQGLRRYGIRNGAQLTVAPTGTISTVAGVEGYGCEPVFALAYLRYVNDGGKQITLQYTSPQFEQALHEAGLDEATIQRVIEQVNQSGTCQDVDELPADIRNVFVVSGDVTAEEHVRMQAALQVFTDNAISKTINFPAGTPPDEVAKAYLLGWKLGCKGMTVYVTGSREKVVLETAETRQKKSGEAPPTVEQPRLFNEEKKPRARYLSGKTYRVLTPLGTTYVTVNENGEGRGEPFEVFLHTSKAGSDTAAVSEALGRLISYILRLASTVSPRNRLKEIVRQLSGIGGVRAIGFGPTRVSSLPDGIAQVLQEYLNESEDEWTGSPGGVVQPVPEHQLALPVAGIVEPQAALPLERKRMGDLCPECGEATLVNEEGCRKCYNCGFSEC